VIEYNPRTREQDGLDETRIMTDLASRECVPCRGGVPPLSAEAATPLLAQLDDWQVEAGHHLLKIFKLPDFAAALNLVNKFGAIADKEGHHPDLLLCWGRVEARIWTHKIDGLSESDFILAAKFDVVFGRNGR
jgi:4a-hydroxytetrahydrobiopterin dehydratase